MKKNKKMVQWVTFLLKGSFWFWVLTSAAKKWLPPSEMQKLFVPLEEISFYVMAVVLLSVLTVVAVLMTVKTFREGDNPEKQKP
jgi:hypothetical protein